MIDPGRASRILQAALSTGGDFAELFLEDRNDTAFKCIKGRVNGITSLHIHGAGVYVLNGTESAYVFTNDTSFSGLLDTARRAASLISGSGVSGKATVEGFRASRTASPNPVEIYPAKTAVGDKVRVAREMDSAARSAGDVVQLSVEYYDAQQNVCIMNSEGLHAEDERVSTRVRLAATVAHGPDTLFEFNDYVRPFGFEAFRIREDYIGFAESQIRAMTARVAAVPAESCICPVVIEGGSGGVLWHELCGHPLEAGHVVEGLGDFGGRLGERVASEKVTLIDDGSVRGMYGSTAVDDEGTPTRRIVLIEGGVLKSYMCDRKGGRQLGMESTGSGRRQSYGYAPTARMHNTYLESGDDDEDEMIRTMGDGLYVKTLGGGSSGAEFSIEVKDGYRVRDGKIAHQVKGLTLGGTGAEIAFLVDRVGRKLIPEDGGSFCGGPSGLLPTTCYQPRVRISRMNVGGAG